MFYFVYKPRILRLFVFLVRAAGERLLQEKCRQASLQHDVQSRIDHAAHVLVCPTCKQSECLPQAIGARTAEVLWVGFETRFQVQVPVRVCSGCKTTFTVCPLHIGCFPSSAKFGWKISNYAPYNTAVLWFDLALVRYAELTSHHMKRVSMWQFAELLDRMHITNHSPVKIQFDRLRKALAISVHEFGYLLSHTEDMKALGVDDWPSGMFGECGGCWKAGESVTLKGLDRRLHGGDPQRSPHSCKSRLHCKNMT
jgi:hypothetical protein